MKNRIYSLSCGLLIAAACVLSCGTHQALAQSQNRFSFNSIGEGQKLVAGFLTRGDDATAYSVMQELLVRFPGETDSILKAGDQLTRKEDIGHIGNFDTRIRRSLAYYHKVYAQSLLQHQHINEALNEYQRTVDIEPQNPVAYMVTGLDLLSADDPVCATIACRNLKKAQNLGWTDFTLPIMIGMAQEQAGDLAGALQTLRAAVDGIPPSQDPKTMQFRQDILVKMSDLQHRLSYQPQPTTLAENRQYQIPSGAMSIVVATDPQRRLIKLALAGHHDPDGGAQDGIDDGIIELSMDKLVQPGQAADIIRPRQ